MKVELTVLESKVFGRNVLVISDPDIETDFAAFERSYIETYYPVYVSCKVPLEDVPTINGLEEHGFRLVECQVKGVIKFSKLWDVLAYHYRFERVTSESALEQVLQLAETTFTHDRFTMDPAIHRGVSGERYRLYTLKSYEDPEEFVYRLYDPVSDETLAFKTCRRVSAKEVQFFLSGVHPKMKGLGLGPISNYFYFNELFRQGIKTAYGYVSAHNYVAVNMDIGVMGFRAVGAFAVLRKVYP